MKGAICVICEKNRVRVAVKRLDGKGVNHLSCSKKLIKQEKLNKKKKELLKQFKWSDRK